jgi:hypothetical protein
VRVALNPNDQLSLLVAVFNGDPAGPNCTGDPQVCWNHFGTGADQRFDSGGLPIAVTGNPGRPLDNDWGFYGIIDQLIWRLPGSEDVKGVGLFGRVIGAPSDQNLVDFYADGGITFTGMIPRRPDDSLAVGLPTPVSPTPCTTSTSIPACPSRAPARRCRRSAIRSSLGRAGRYSRTSNISGSPAAMCPMTQATARSRMQRCSGLAPPSASDEGRVMRSLGL